MNRSEGSIPSSSAAGRTNVLQNHRIYLGAISPTTLVRESNVVGLTANKKSVEKMQTRLDAAGNYAQTDLEYDAYGNVTKLTGPANHLNQRAWDALFRSRKVVCVP